MAIWYVIHGQLGNETIQRSFSSEAEAVDAACRYITVGEFVREVGTEIGDKSSPHLTPDEIIRICQERIDSRE